MLSFYVVSTIFVFVILIITSHNINKDVYFRNKYKNSSIYKKLFTLTIFLFPLINIVLLACLLFFISNEKDNQ